LDWGNQANGPRVPAAGGPQVQTIHFHIAGDRRYRFWPAGLGSRMKVANEQPAREKKEGTGGTKQRKFKFL